MIPWYFEGTRDKYRKSVKPLKFLRKTNVLAHEALREVPTLSSKTLKTLRKINDSARNVHYFSGT